MTTRQRLTNLRTLTEDYLELDSIATKCRGASLVRGRQFYCALARELTAAPLSEIGAVIRRDHASVINSIRRFKDFSKAEIEYKKQFDGLLDLVAAEKGDIQEYVDTEKINSIVILTNEFNKLKIELDTYKNRTKESMLELSKIKELLDGIPTEKVMTGHTLRERLRIEQESFLTK